MCGIAGIMDLAGGRRIPDGVIEKMSQAIYHRGPDEEGFFHRPGLAMASRRLSIVGLADGQQPMSNEDRSVSVVFNGELFDHQEQRQHLRDRGHTLTTHCDTEILPHLWEDHGLAMFEKLRGQFAVALWDEKTATLTLGRDRFGIAPLYWTRQDNWFLFASEIKGLLASGLVPARPDPRGIDQIFSYSALPGPITCFENIQMLRPAHRIQVTADTPSSSARIDVRPYWIMDFPNAGQERDGDPKTLVDEFEKLLLTAVEKRLRADVPVGSYLSGGVDSSMIVALAHHVKGAAITTYTIKVDHPGLDELDAANMVAKYIGTSPPIVQTFGTADATATYPELIHAAEAPVIDTSCAALLQLAKKVHANGQKVVLTGEGADEWLLGYPWYKGAKIMGYLDSIPGLRLGDRIRRAFLSAYSIPQFPPSYRDDVEKAIGGPNAWVDAYGLLTLSKLRLYGPKLQHLVHGTGPWRDLAMDVDRAKQWHPLNRGIWVASRVTLGGLLLQAKGDRVAMNSSVEVRYPFLDEDVFDFTASLHPKWKLKGFRDKHILRLLAERWLPPSVYKRRKVIFRAPLDSFHLDPEPTYVTQLLSEESLKKTGYFDHVQVQHWRKAYQKLSPHSIPRLSIEMGLAAVVATQLWHQKFIDSTIADVPSLPISP